MLIPGLFAATYLVASEAACVTEKKTVLESISRSMELVKNNSIVCWLVLPWLLILHFVYLVYLHGQINGWLWHGLNHLVRQQLGLQLGHVDLSILSFTYLINALISGLCICLYAAIIIALYHYLTERAIRDSS